VLKKIDKWVISLTMRQFIIFITVTAAVVSFFIVYFIIPIGLDL